MPTWYAYPNALYRIYPMFAMLLFVYAYTYRFP